MIRGFEGPVITDYALERLFLKPPGERARHGRSVPQYNPLIVAALSAY
jgi:hypothetical protein